MRATRIALAFGLGLVLTAGAGLSGTPAAAAQLKAVSGQASIGGYPVWAHFSNPTAAAPRDYTILNEVRRLIDAAPRGSTIKGAIHSLSVPFIAEALVRAQDEREVTVEVVIDGKNEALTTPGMTTLKQLDHLRFCGNPAGGRSCISTSADGDMHTKMFTFTATTDPTGAAHTNVAWFGSANMTYATGPDSSNNAVTVYGDAALTAGLNANFADLWAGLDHPGNDYYNATAPRGYYQASAADVYASPEAQGQTDTIVTRLNDLTPDANCRLRIGMAAVTAGRPALVQLVKDFRAAGCWVWMTVGSDTTGGIAMDRGVYNDLLGAGIAIKHKDNFHDKFFLMYGRYGTASQYRVYTGSQNWTEDALSDNDEIFVKMGPESGTDRPLYDAYYAHFVTAYDSVTKVCTVANFPC